MTLPVCAECGHVRAAHKIPPMCIECQPHSAHGFVRLPPNAHIKTTVDDYIRSCEVKERRWRSPMAAAMAAIRMERHKPGERFEYYECRWAPAMGDRHWHVGHALRLKLEEDSEC